MHGTEVDIVGLRLLSAKERVHLCDLVVYKINPKEIGWEDTGLIHQAVQMAGLCKDGSESSVTINARKLLIR
jgi:hypothetical protein